VPGHPQPSQKAFDSRLWDSLRRFDAGRPVYVESESKKVGDLRVAEALVERMRAAPCVWLELPLEQRVALLMEDYDFFVKDTRAFCERLDALRVLRGNEMVNGWQVAAQAGRTAEVVRDLLVAHYDPVYLQSMRRNFAQVATPLVRLEWDGSGASLESAARLALSG
jgi:tRNA 2-selenouridine synthase